MESFTVRRYRPTDAAAVWDVHVRDLSAMLPVFSPAWATDLHDVERYYLPRGEFLVAEDDERVVATGGYLPVGDTTAGLRRLRVRPNWLTSGVFDAVLDELETLAVARGFEYATLDSNDHMTYRNGVLREQDYEEIDRQPLPEWSTDILYFEKEL
jgi:N-acetylglutamate synthase-like GNAT family acetyltransferase